MLTLLALCRNWSEEIWTIWATTVAEKGAMHWPTVWIPIHQDRSSCCPFEYLICLQSRWTLSARYDTIPWDQLAAWCQADYYVRPLPSWQDQWSVCTGTDFCLEYGFVFAFPTCMAWARTTNQGLMSDPRARNPPGNSEGGTHLTVKMFRVGP